MIFMIKKKPQNETQIQFFLKKDILIGDTTQYVMFVQQCLHAILN